MSDYDVFISYAWSDNTNVIPWEEGGESRWVRCFKAVMQERLDRRMGRTGAAKIFMDTQDIRPGNNLNQAIVDALNHTRVFLPLISAGYFHPNSTCCKLEREHFISTLGTSPAKENRIVGVILDGPGGFDDWKKYFFPDVLAFPFFEKVVGSDAMVRFGNDAVDAKFLARIDSLADILCKRLRELQPSAATAATAVTAPTAPTAAAAAPAVPRVPEKGRVLFAAVPGHLEQQRTELVNVLIADGWTVFPPENECPADISECEQWVTKTISQEKIQAYAQITDSHPWKPGLHDAAQLRGAAKASDVELMVYRLADVDLAQVTHKEHRAWLETLSSKTIPQLRVDLPDALQKMLVRRREAERLRIQQEQAPLTSVYITVSVADRDEPLAGAEIVKLAALDAYGSIGSKAGEGLEESFDEIHGLLTVYGNEDYNLRVFPVLNRWRTILARRKLSRTQAPPFGVLVLKPPPEDKDFCLNRCIVPRMHRIPHGDAAAMDEYLRDVREFVNAKNLKGGAP